MNRKNITKTVIHLTIAATRFALVTTLYTLVTTRYTFVAKHSNLVAHNSIIANARKFVFNDSFDRNKNILFKFDVDSINSFIIFKYFNLKVSILFEIFVH
jgi:hypothetical protein